MQVQLLQLLARDLPSVAIIAGHEDLDREIACAFEDGGLDFGRFDLRYASDEDLKAGRGFKIIELNGTMSESTNLYARGSASRAPRGSSRWWRSTTSRSARTRARRRIAETLCRRLP